MRPATHSVCRVAPNLSIPAAAEFDWAAAKRNIEAVRPGMMSVHISVKKGEGMPEWVAMLADRRDEWQRSRSLPTSHHP
jgi:Ni2+-binding GTPase involved in maturation of urease and hydrogenase